MLHAENSILCIFAHCPFNNLSKAITTRPRPPYLIISFPMPSVAELKFRKFRKLPRTFVRERRRAKSRKRQKLSFQGAKSRRSADKVYLKLKFRWQSINLQRIASEHFLHSVSDMANKLSNVQEICGIFLAGRISMEVF